MTLPAIEVAWNGHPSVFLDSVSCELSYVRTQPDISVRGSERVLLSLRRISVMGSVGREVFGIRVVRHTFSHVDFEPTEGTCR